MTRLTRVLATLAVAVPALAGSLTQAERSRALSELHASRKQLLDALNGLTPAQWSFKADDRSWSIAECAEHIALSEDMLFDLVTKKVMSGPAEPGRQRMVEDETLLQMLVDRSHKATAPEALQPKRRFASPEAAATAFRQSRDHTLDYIRETQDDLRSHSAPHPAFGALDAYQWVLYISGHSRRHVLQIDEVKANPRFPKP